MLNSRKNEPALFTGCLLLLTAGVALFPHWSYLLGFLALLLPLFLRKQWKLLCASGVLSLLFFFYVTQFTSLPFTLEEKIEGVGHFEPNNVRITQSPFNRSFFYQGMLHTFTADDGRVWKNLPCQIYFPVTKQRPLANVHYEIRGTLAQKAPHAFALKADKQSPWNPVPDSFSFAEWRYEAKERVRLFLKEKIPQTRVFTFFVALAVGDLDERTLSMEFAKVGLQHILGISGFHFVLLAGFLGFLLRLIFPFKVTAILLFILLTAYFFFVGGAPATMRGWIAISVYLLARLFHFPTNALNALGVGLTVEILHSPFVVTSIGFQLSFLCTWAILLLYPLARAWLARLMPRKSLREISELSTLRQHNHLFSSLFREAVALNLAVHLASLPLLLFLFHKFPLQSLLYNLFLPFCYSAALLFLLTAILVGFLFPPLGDLIHALNNGFTAALLEITANMPVWLDLPLRVRNFPYALVIGMLAGLFLLGNKLEKRTEN